jgi:hypothetical protein
MGLSDLSGCNSPPPPLSIPTNIGVHVGAVISRIIISEIYQFAFTGHRDTGDEGSGDYPQSEPRRQTRGGKQAAFRGHVSRISRSETLPAHHRHLKTYIGS